MVNVTDFESTEVPQDILKALFDKQRELAKKYVDIEGMGDLLETTKTNLQTQRGQIWIKDFAWRVTEELTEAAQPLQEFDGYETSWSEAKELHVWEEVSDALHFFLELAIIAGYTEEDFRDHMPVDYMAPRDLSLPHDHEHFFLYSYEIIYYLGIACNLLKNKKWKKTQMATDEIAFRKNILLAWDYLMTLFLMFGHTPADIYHIYFRKHQVNQFRQRSNY